MGITAKARATTALRGTTSLPPERVLEAVKDAADSIKGGGKSLLTTGVANIGAQVNIVRESGSKMTFSLTSGKKLVELCTFSATATANGAGTEVCVGGLETWKTQQQKLFYVIPAGPKQIYGMDPYKRFLAAVQQQLLATDPAAALTIAQAER